MLLRDRFDLPDLKIVRILLINWHVWQLQITCMVAIALLATDINDNAIEFRYKEYIVKHHKISHA
jgi:hypothetical protein